MRWETEETGDKWYWKRHSGSKNERSIGVRASNNKNPESENDDNPLRASKMKDFRHPAKSLYQNELNLEDEIIASEEVYHTCSTEFSSDSSMDPHLQKPNFQGQSLLLRQRSTAHPTQFCLHCPGLCVSTLSIVDCFMQVVAILAQNDFDIFQIEGRVFQYWQVRICSLQFLEIVRSISCIHVGMTIGNDIFFDLSVLISNLDSKSFATNIWFSMNPCNIQIHWQTRQILLFRSRSLLSDSRPQMTGLLQSHTKRTLSEICSHFLSLLERLEADHCFSLMTG